MYVVLCKTVVASVDVTSIMLDKQRKQCKSSLKHAVYSLPVHPEKKVDLQLSLHNLHSWYVGSAMLSLELYSIWNDFPNPHICQQLSNLSIQVPLVLIILDSVFTNTACTPHVCYNILTLTVVWPRRPDWKPVTMSLMPPRALGISAGEGGTSSTRA